MSNSPLLLVSACALFNTQNELLLTQRPVDKPLGGYWEFPGGKLEPYETPEQALIRELQEEINIKIQNFKPLTFLTHHYENFNLIFFLYTCHSFEGKIKANENQAMKWISVDQLKNIKLPPADIEIIPLLKNYLNQL